MRGQIDHNGRVLFFGDTHVETNVGCFQYVSGSSVKPDHVAFGLYAYKSDAELAMRVKRGVCEAFALVLAEEFGIRYFDVVNLIARTLSVHFLPFFVTVISFSVD